MRRTSVLLAVAASLLGLGCQSIGALSESRVGVDWTRTLYPLESFAYHPQERGECLWLDDGFTQGDGLLIVASRDRSVRGLNARTGAEYWRFETGGPNVAQPVAIEGDVLIASTDGRLYRLRRRSGRKIWAVDIPGKGSVLQAPSISGSKIFIATMENRLAAIDAKTGAVLWDRRRPQQGQFTITGHAGVLIDGSTVVTGFNDGWLIGFSQADGATLWSTDLSAGSQGFVDVDTTPLLYEGMFIVGSHGYGLFALDHVSQDVKWTLKGEGFLSPVIAGGTLYAATGRGDVVAVDAKSGKLLWKRHYSDELTTSPIATRKYLLLPTSAGLYVLDRRSGRVLERVGDSHGFSARPVFVGATLYALANSGRFYALGIY